ncbi:MAG: response regulator [Coriobacteriales bacterium]|jgi:signal transduction histidine kinase/ActR/RegA family two-component response regulator|nr:response regulator [Coriobacteriales bacterium]
MILQLVLFSVSLVTCSVNIYFIALIWLSDKRTMQIRALIAMGVATCYWTLFDAVAQIAQSYTYAYMYTLRSVMLVVAPVCFLWYMLLFVRSSFIHNRVVHAIVWVIPSFDIVLLLTNPLHRLIFSRDGFPLPEYGPLFVFHAAVAYLTIAVGVVLLVRYIVKTRPSPAFSVAWLFACFVPILVNVLFTIGVIDLSQDIAPFGFALIFMLFALYSYRSRLNSLRTMALSDVFASYGDAIVLVNAGDRIEEVNATFCETFPDCPVDPQVTTVKELFACLQGHGGVDAAALFDRAASDTLPESGEELSIGVAPASSGRTDVAAGTASAPASLQRRTFKVVRRNVRKQSGRVTGWLLILSDVSAYYQMISEINQQNTRLADLRQKAEAASEAKSTFLAKMSHEMRTPLNAIIGLSEIVLRRSLDADSHGSIEKVYESGRNLLSVINDILDISKIESGHFELVPLEYRTADMINDAVNINKVRIGSKPIQLKLQVDPRIPATLYGDELRVRQIFNNYLSNAIKYTHEGTVTLAVRLDEGGGDPSCGEGGRAQGEEARGDVARPCDGGHVRMRIEVSDTGIGIRPDELSELYSEYQQADLKANRGLEGTGLGLSICRHLTELMGGTVEVRSEFGKGSTFISVVCQALPAGWEDGAVETVGAGTAAALEAFRYTVERSSANDAFTFVPVPDARVLVVDDVEVNLEVAKGMLEPYRLTVDCVDNGAEAVELIRGGEPRYDLVFMDQMMPEMDGFETVRAIREMVATDYARSLPIIALTANAMVGSEERFLQADFQGYLAKPIDPAALNGIVTRWLADR